MVVFCCRESLWPGLPIPSGSQWARKLPGSATRSVAEGPYSQNVHAFSSSDGKEGPRSTYFDSGRLVWKLFTKTKNKLCMIVFSQKHKATKPGSETGPAEILEFRDIAKLCPVKHLKIHFEQTQVSEERQAAVHQLFQTACACGETNSARWKRCCWRVRAWTHCWNSKHWC